MDQTYIAFLRGINVGGHHKVPMADLRALLEKEKYKNVSTFLNSGNVIFDAKPEQTQLLEEKLASQLEDHFGFSIPVIICAAKELLELINKNPFKAVDVTKEIRLYITFLKEKPKNNISLPFITDDHSFKILEILDKKVCSILDLSKTSTVDSMALLGKIFDTDMTTRNWNTLKRIAKKLVD